MKLLPRFSNKLWGAAAILASILALALGLVRLTVPASAHDLESGSESPSSSVAPATTISTNITTDTTWDLTGSPYLVDASVSISPGVTLTIAPGVQVLFNQYDSLIAEGTLNAVGTATQPIIFTGNFPAGKTPGPGWWDSIQILGTASQPNTGSTIQYATVEYGGNGVPEIEVDNGKVNITDSQILSSGSDGFYAGPGGAGSSIHNNQILNNSNFAVENNDPAVDLMADNNWWGSASGPVVANGCNPTGSGGRINGKVAFEPFLTSGTLQSTDLTGGDAILVSMSPLRWFVPADGVSRAWVRITVRDGNGLPLSGRTVNLISSLGSVTDGGTTDVQGQTWAFITSTTSGDAQLMPSLSYLGNCESARGASATITFTSASSADQVLPDSAAPYMNDGIQVNPMPVIQGVATTLSAHFTNPDSSPITLTATFGIAQEGIGLTFGPIGEQQITIPANGQGTAQVVWTPLISGHYCVQVLFSAQAASSLSAALTGPLGFFSSGSSQRNLDIAPAHLNTYSQKGAAGKAQSGINAISNAQTAIDLASSPADATGFFIPNWLFSKILDFNFSKWGIVNGILKKDPPRQDYTVQATLEQFTFTPVQAGNGISAARAQAANDLMTAALDLTSKLDAAEISLDRYSGATEANSLQWASLQASAYLYYRSLSASAMTNTADKLDAMIAEMQSEGIPDRAFTVDDIKAYQDRLFNYGFNTDDLTAAQAIGLTPDEIEEIRQTRINEDPNLAAGSVTALVQAMSSALRQAAQAFQATSPATSALAYQAGLSGATPPNQLFLTSTQTYSIQVGNPQLQPETIDLKVRPIDLPDDWGVSITPSTVTLNPGQQITATLVVAPSPTSAQGSHPRVAVEAYIQSNLIGGVVQDILVPFVEPFDGKLRLYLPTITK